MAARVEQLANGDLLVYEVNDERHPSRVTKGTREHGRLLKAAAEGRVELFRAGGRFGGPAGPPEPTAEETVERLGLADSPGGVQRDAIARAAYSGRLPLAQLKVLRRAGFLPHDVDAAGPDGD